MTTTQALQILELTAPITREALKNAYRDALMVWHPDRFEGNKALKAKAESRTYQINEAYAFLKDTPESGYPFQASGSAQAAKPSPSPAKPPPPPAKPPPPPARPPHPPPTRESPPPSKAATSAPSPKARRKPGVMWGAAWVVAAIGSLLLIAVLVEVQSSRMRHI